MIRRLSKPAVRPVSILCTQAWWPVSKMIGSCGESNTRCRARGEFDHTEIGPQMTASGGHLVHQELPDLPRQVGQLLLRQALQISGAADLFEHPLSLRRIAAPLRRGGVHVRHAVVVGVGGLQFEDRPVMPVAGPQHDGGQQRGQQRTGEDGDLDDVLPGGSDPYANSPINRDTVNPMPASMATPKTSIQRSDTSRAARVAAAINRVVPNTRASCRRPGRRRFPGRSDHAERSPNRHSRRNSPRRRRRRTPGWPGPPTPAG